MAWIRAIAKWLNPRRRLIALAFAGWTILVIIGAGRAPGSDDWVNVPDLGAVVVLAAAVAAVLGIVLMIALRPTTRKGRGPGGQRSRRLPWLAMLVFLLLLIAFAPKQDEPEEVTVDTQQPVTTADDVDGVGIAESDDGVGGGDVLVLLLIGAMAAGVVLYTARRGALAESAISGGLEHELAADMGPVIDAAAERLKVGSEPRAAVIAAYAGLEQAMAARGQRRRPAETPTEHMSRALAAIPTLADPAVRLGALYEVARFSDHPIGEEDRHRAAAALEQAREALSAMADHAP